MLDELSSKEEILELIKEVEVTLKVEENKLYTITRKEYNNIVGGLLLYIKEIPIMLNTIKELREEIRKIKGNENESN